MATIATVRIEASTQRNGIAAALSNACFRKQVIKAKRGKGSYTRKPKHAARAFG